MLVASVQPLTGPTSKAHSQFFDLYSIYMCLKAHLRGVCSLGMSVTRLPLCCPALMLGRAKEGEVSLLAAACTFSSPSGNTCTWSIDNCTGDKQPMNDPNRQQMVAAPGGYDELDGDTRRLKG